MLLNLASRLDDSDDDHDALNSSRATIKNLRPPSVKVHDMSRNESVLISSSCKQKIKMNKISEQNQVNLTNYFKIATLLEKSVNLQHS